MAYTTLANAKAYLGIPTATTADDALLTSFLAQVTNFVDTTCGYKLESTAGTRYYNLEVIGNLSLYLDYPLLSITTLTNGNAVVIPSTEYRLFPLNYSTKWEIRLKVESTYTWDFTNSDSLITVEGNWGLYSTVPDEITHVANRMIGYLYRQKDNANDLDRTVALQSGLLLPSQIPSDVTSIILKYKRIT